MYTKTFVRIFGSDYKLEGYTDSTPTNGWLDVYFTQEQLEQFKSSPLYKPGETKTVQIETDDGLIQAFRMAEYHFVEYATMGRCYSFN
jgi:hypothetical protein